MEAVFADELPRALLYAKNLGSFLAGGEYVRLVIFDKALYDCLQVHADRYRSLPRPKSIHLAAGLQL